MLWVGEGRRGRHENQLSIKLIQREAGAEALRLPEVAIAN